VSIIESLNNGGVNSKAKTDNTNLEVFRKQCKQTIPLMHQRVFCSHPAK